MKTETLAMVIPVYNERDAIGNVLTEWVRALEDLGIEYRIHAYNDGSKDDSLAILQGFSEMNQGRVFVHDKPNSGHGPTILQGYRDHVRNHEWIFQIDSDDEMGPEGFHLLWNERSEYDFLIGIRDGREQPLPRRVVSGKSVWDVNCPYRLMRTEKFRALYDRIPSDTFSPNVIISGFVGLAKLRFYECPIPHRDRRTGEVSIRKWRLLRAAMKSFGETIAFRYSKNLPD
jgi:dolichol-phosphate mannosyltransferase